MTLSIDDKWHVNANPASLEFLIPTTIAGEVRSIAYPAGELLAFAFAGEELSVYSGSVTVSGEVKEGEASVFLTYQACDDRRCLPPVTESVSLTP